MEEAPAENIFWNFTLLYFGEGETLLRTAAIAPLSNICFKIKSQDFLDKQTKSSLRSWLPVVFLIVAGSFVEVCCRVCAERLRGTREWGADGR